jgi:hypothetical protein
MTTQLRFTAIGSRIKRRGRLFPFHCDARRRVADSFNSGAFDGLLELSVERKAWPIWD